jgi:hypothetical protein
MDFDLTIIAIVFALILLLVFFSAVVLYLSFRIKETFKKDTRRGANIAKTAFLIGILFLAGGIFYFTAGTLINTNQNSQPTPTISPTPTANPTTFTSPTPQETNLPQSPTPTSSPTIKDPTFSAFYPSTASMGSQFELTFTILNMNSITLKNTVIQTELLFQKFNTISSTHPVSANIITIGDLNPGSTTVSLQLTPTRPGEVNDTATLICQNIESQPTELITIQVRGNSG